MQETDDGVAQVVSIDPDRWACVDRGRQAPLRAHGRHVGESPSRGRAPRR